MLPWICFYQLFFSDHVFPFLFIFYPIYGYSNYFKSAITVLLVQISHTAELCPAGATFAVPELN